MPQQLHFALIGCRKTGSTWLYDNLAHHPDLALPTKVKETHFFSRYFSRGAAWYWSLYGSPRPGALHGEIDPELILYPEAADHLAAFAPDARLIVILRRPADLFLSSYLHAVRKGDVQCSAEEAWDKHPQFRAEVKFSDRLEPFRKKFEDGRILYMIYDDLVADAEGFLHTVTQFIGVEPHIDSASAHRRVNPARVARFQAANALMARAARTARKLDIHWAVNAAKRLGIERLLTRRISSQQKEKLSAELDARIERETISEVIWLEKVLQRDLGHWRRTTSQSA